MSIKLKGSSDGSVSFDAPADTSPSGSDITLTLPTSAGSANQFLKNSGIAGELEYSSMVETSTGVGIGNTAPDATLRVTESAVNEAAQANDIAVFERNDNGYLKIYSPNNKTGGIAFGDPDDNFIGAVAYDHTDNALELYVNNSERARIDSSGNLRFPEQQDVVFGVDLNTSSGDGGDLTVKSGNGSGSGNDSGNLYLAAGRGGSSANSGFIGFGIAQTTNTSGLNVEHARITSDGELRIGTTAYSNSRLFVLAASGASACRFQVSANGNGVIDFFNAGSGYVASIIVNASSVSYNTSSDYRLKENVVDLDGAITRVKQLQPRRFNFIADADTTVDGFLAHEAQTVVPEAVTGTHNEVDDDGNAVMQGIDQSKLVPLLTAALQEAIAKIETLETKVAALEAA